VSKTASIFLIPNFGKNSRAEERKDFPQSTRIVLFLMKPSKKKEESAIRFDFDKETVG